MKVKNRKAVRRLSVKSFKAAGRRNITAAVAIAMTTVLFTALFTIMMSINTSYESYTFRQIGGYAHGTFKDVTSQQASMIESNSKVKAVGRRITAGIITDGGFAKIPAEISYMDDNNAKWSYINLSKGHMPEAEDEIIMDTAALDALGVDPEIGAKIKLTYDMLDVNSTVGSRTDTFRLVGWWDYDDISPVHFINVSEAYVRKVEQAAFGGGADHLREDINVMFRTSIGIEENMKTVENDLGFQSDDLDKDGYVRYGVNWGVYGIAGSGWYRSGDGRSCCGAADTDHNDRISDHLQYIQDIGQQRHKILRTAEDRRGDPAAASKNCETAGYDALCGRLPGGASDRISGRARADAGDHGIYLSGNFVCGGEHITCDIRSICIVFHRDGISVMRQTGSDGVKSFSRRSCKVCRCFAWSA